MDATTSTKRRPSLKTPPSCLNTDRPRHARKDLSSSFLPRPQHHRPPAPEPCLMERSTVTIIMIALTRSSRKSARNSAWQRVEISIAVPKKANILGLKKNSPRRPRVTSYPTMEAIHPYHATSIAATGPRQKGGHGTSLVLITATILVRQGERQKKTRRCQVDQERAPR